MTTMNLKKFLRILVIENNEIDCKILKGMLSESSVGTFQLDFTDSLHKAFEYLQKHNFDVVLLDLNLPDCKGLETLKRVNDEFPDIAIVINTGAYEDDLGLKAVSHGAQDYLIKGKYTSYALSKALYYAVERKRVEEELKSAYTRLKEAQSQLIQIEKMNVIGGLASGVAHEVKNPLATILYGIEYLTQKIQTEDEKIGLTLKTMKESAQKANNIVKDLLDFAHSSKLDRKPENLNDIIEKSLQLTKVLLDKHRVQAIKQFGVIPSISVDANRIEQVIVDLILNAAYVMPEGGALVFRTLTRKLTKNYNDVIFYIDKKFSVGDSIVLVEIEDTGPGIPAEIKDKIFDPFFTTRRASGGVGLGLSVAKNIIQSHGGEIMLENRKEGGARVKICLKV